MNSQNWSQCTFTTTTLILAQQGQVRTSDIFFLMSSVIVRFTPWLKTMSTKFLVVTLLLFTCHIIGDATINRASTEDLQHQNLITSLLAALNSLYSFRVNYWLYNVRHVTWDRGRFISPETHYVTVLFKYLSSVTPLSSPRTEIAV